MFKTDLEQSALGVRVGLNLVALFAIIAQPLIPDAAGKVLDAMGIPSANRNWPSADTHALFDALPHGLNFSAPDILFNKIEDAQVEEWGERFGGG